VRSDKPSLRKATQKLRTFDHELFRSLKNLRRAGGMTPLQFVNEQGNRCLLIRREGLYLIDQFFGRHPCPDYIFVRTLPQAGDNPDTELITGWFFYVIDHEKLDRTLLRRQFQPERLNAPTGHLTRVKYQGHNGATNVAGSQYTDTLATATSLPRHQG
jgi:hypothetical protein